MFHRSAPSSVVAVTVSFVVIHGRGLQGRFDSIAPIPGPREITQRRTTTDVGNVRSVVKDSGERYLWKGVIGRTSPTWREKRNPRAMSPGKKPGATARGNGLRFGMLAPSWAGVGPGSLDRDALRQVARLVHIAPSQQGDVIREELEGHHRHERLQPFRNLRDEYNLVRPRLDMVGQ